MVGFTNILPTISANLLLLDAHTVIDGDGGLYRVPISVFEQFKLDGLVHVEAAPASILERRTLDKERARPQRSLSELADYQQLSADCARQIANQLGIWAATIESGDQATLEQLLRSN